MSIHIYVCRAYMYTGLFPCNIGLAWMGPEKHEVYRI